jgi:hypothetical protein
VVAVGGSGKDFFISHATVNRRWAEWIAVELERAGYTTIVESFDFRPGYRLGCSLPGSMSISSARGSC